MGYQVPARRPLTQLAHNNGFTVGQHGDRVYLIVNGDFFDAGCALDDMDIQEWNNGWWTVDRWVKAEWLEDEMDRLECENDL